MKLERPERENPTIPTCSMADIAFLLIIFFMLTTVFAVARGLHVSLPLAKATKKLPKKNITHIWVSKEKAISIDDNIVSIQHISAIMQRKIQVNPNLIVSILMDKDVEYGVLSEVFEQLKEARALRVSLATLLEKGM